MRLIDISPLIKAQDICEDMECRDCELEVRDCESMMDLIMKMPTIDAVPVIRCKDCNHYDDGLCRRWIYAHVTNEDSFCSGAERKEE